MVPEAQRLHAALVSAFPSYAAEVFADRGYPMDRPSAEAIERATAFLDVELAGELEMSFTEQRRSPMEVFRMALEALSRSLADRGIEPVQAPRPGVPADVYGLTPGSSSALGSDAHAAHLAWGTAKAADFIGDRSPVKPAPMTIVMSGNRDDREQILASLNESGIASRAVRNPGAVIEAIDAGSVRVALVDLSHRSAREAIARLTDAGVSTVVFGDDIDDLVETGLRAQGVRLVVARSSLLAEPARYVPALA